MNDLIWIAGHGEIDHWRHGSSRLVAGHECFVGIEDMIELTPTSAGRRLLVLNICDGGMSAVNGGISRLGLAPMLANAKQATISHHWPVQPPMAGAFGTLLAASIADDIEFFPAFQAALNNLRCPLEEVIMSIRARIPGLEIVQRIQNSNTTTQSIFNFGSGNRQPCSRQTPSTNRFISNPRIQSTRILPEITFPHTQGQKHAFLTRFLMLPLFDLI